MAKNVAITTPTINDIRSMTINFSAGAGQKVKLVANVQAADDHTTHDGHDSNAASTFTAAEQTAMVDLATAALAKLVAAKGL